MKCQSPDCTEWADHQFALVPLCELHYYMVKEESEKNYKHAIQYGSFLKDRPWHNKLKDKMAEARKEAGRMIRNGENRQNR